MLACLAPHIILQGASARGAEPSAETQPIARGGLNTLCCASSEPQARSAVAHSAWQGIRSSNTPIYLENCFLHAAVDAAQDGLQHAAERAVEARRGDLKSAPGARWRRR